MVSFDDVQRLNLGYVLKPAEATGTGRPQVVPILAYFIAHPDGGCRAVAFHPTSGRLLTGSAKGGVHFWDVGSQSPTPARIIPARLIVLPAIVLVVTLPPDTVTVPVAPSEPTRRSPEPSTTVSRRPCPPS